MNFLHARTYDVEVQLLLVNVLQGVDDGYDLLDRQGGGQPRREHCQHHDAAQEVRVEEDLVAKKNYQALTVYLQLVKYPSGQV